MLLTDLQVPVASHYRFVRQLHDYNWPQSVRTPLACFRPETCAVGIPFDVSLKSVKRDSAKTRTRRAAPVIQGHDHPGQVC